MRSEGVEICLCLSCAFVFDLRDIDRPDRHRWPDLRPWASRSLIFVVGCGPSVSLRSCVLGKRRGLIQIHRTTLRWSAETGGLPDDGLLR